MENLPQAQVVPGAYLTLHYRLASLEGNDIVTTFNGNPATLELGSGQLAPFLEACLLGLPEGAEASFTLTPEQSFGDRNPCRALDQVHDPGPLGGGLTGTQSS